MELRQQVSAVCQNLLNAVTQLEGQGNSSVDNRSPLPVVPSGQSLLPVVPSGQSPLPGVPSGQSPLPMIPSGQNARPGLALPQRSASNELKHLFHYNSCNKRKSSTKAMRPASKKKKLKTWNHTFICLSSPTDEYPPDASMRAKLQLAGLGEKKLSLFLYDASDEFYDELLDNYPKLASGGGYELLRQGGSGGRQLELITVPPGGYSVEYVKNVVHSAKVYIRPLQASLDVTVAPATNQKFEFSTIREEKCLKCKKYIPVHKLKEHIMKCNGTTAECRFLSDIEDSKEKLTPCSLKHNVETVQTSGNSSVDPMVIDDCGTDLAEVEDTLVEYAINRSIDEEPSNIANIVSRLRKNLKESEYFPMIVWRENILETSLSRLNKPSFDPAKRLKVEFVGESGSDTGGLTREWFTIFAKALTPKYVDLNGCFEHNSIALQAQLIRYIYAQKLHALFKQDKVFYYIGQIASMCLVHGGGGFHILSKSVYAYISGTELADVIVSPDEVCNFEAKHIINKIMSAKTLSEFKEVYSSHFGDLAEYGITKPTTAISLDDKITVVQSIALHHVLLRSKAELDQFMQGLSCLGTKDCIVKYPKLLNDFFTVKPLGTKMLTSETIRNLFQVVRYSETGSNERRKEEQIYIFFVDYLEEIEAASDVQVSLAEDENCDHGVTLAKVLIFFSGAEEIPPEGFPNDPVLNFNPNNPFPTASTCTVELTLPTKYSGDYFIFKKMMDIGLTCHGGFGKS